MVVKEVEPNLETFFVKRPVFTLAELAAWYASRRAVAARTVETILFYHAKRGRVVRVRRGLYAAVPPGSRTASLSVDPFLLAGKMTDDAVLAYHTALEFHGKAHTVTQQFLYLTKRAARPFTFRGQRFRGLSIPPALLAKKVEPFGVVTADRVGLDVRVTSMERTMVDVFDRPQLGGGWEEIWRSLESVEFFDLGVVIEYATLLGNATTVAKVGFFLEQHKDALMVEDQHLNRLRAHCPKKPHYLSRRDRQAGKLVSEWNLIVPPAVLEKRWQEIL
ncbi:MAG: transcriptional regulator [Acidobacteria bacterium RIFCSPLOWO2_12_FULL_54_10]|nr:MAG: transcriptional regulator [Acidobacteria bacterium RIFCSPLOWO2_12_FULL_54_10]